MQAVTTALARCPLFGGLSPDELTQIAQASRLVTVRAGDLVFREGQACDGFYVLAEGSVRLYKIGPDGRERTLHLVRPPHAFAEAVMFAAGSYPAFATAVEESRLILVRRTPFLRILREQPDTALRLFASLSAWMHRLLDTIENETFLNARGKLANYLLREARHQRAGDGPCLTELNHPVPCSIELNQPKKDIASQLGMAPETLSRALNVLEARGLIRASGRRIEIPDSEALENLLLGEADEE